MLLHYLAAALGNIGGGRKAAGFDAGADDPLNLAQPAVLLGGDQGDRLARLAGATSTADAVNVSLGAFRNVVVDDVGDVRDVETAGRDIGRDQDIGLATPEAAHHAVTLGLREVAVERLDRVAACHQGLAEFVHAVLGAAEDHGRAGLLGVQNPGQRVHLARPGHLEVALPDLRDRHLLAGNADGFRVSHVPAGEVHDPRRHGGGEEGGLALLGHLLEDPLDVLDEAHVQHFVGFVEDEVAG